MPSQQIRLYAHRCALWIYLGSAWSFFFEHLQHKNPRPGHHIPKPFVVIRVPHRKQKTMIKPPSSISSFPNSSSSSITIFGIWSGKLKRTCAYIFPLPWKSIGKPSLLLIRNNLFILETIMALYGKDRGKKGKHKKTINIGIRSYRRLDWKPSRSTKISKYITHYRIVGPRKNSSGKQQMKTLLSNNPTLACLLEDNIVI